jgi:hypothetical protein
MLAVALLWLVVVVMGFLMARTLHRIGDVLEQTGERLRAPSYGVDPGGLKPGTQLPSFRAQGLNGALITDNDVRGSPVLVVFLAVSCPRCALLARDLRLADQLGVSLYVILNAAADAEELGVTQLDHVLIQNGGHISSAFQTSATPHAFAIDSDGVIVANGSPSTFEGLRELALPALRRGGSRPS